MYLINARLIIKITTVLSMLLGQLLLKIFYYN